MPQDAGGLILMLILPAKTMPWQHEHAVRVLELSEL